MIGACFFVLKIILENVLNKKEAKKQRSTVTVISLMLGEANENKDLKNKRQTKNAVDIV